MQNLFVIDLQYKKPLAVVDEFLNEHRNFLTEGYRKNIFIVSGPKNPRVGGIIIANSKSLSDLTAYLQQDPFWREEIADYQITEFLATKWHTDLLKFITIFANLQTE